MQPPTISTPPNSAAPVALAAPLAPIASGWPSARELAARVDELRREAASVSDRTLRASLIYEVAYLTETALNQPAHAVQEYLAAYNLDHRFRLPLYALLRIFERRRSFKNLS